jgi:N-methylhydantoinase A
VGVRIGIDTGGTFTDVVAIDDHSGQVWSTKTPTTPADPSLGFMAAVHAIAALTARSTRDISQLAHGTTVATNALLSEEFPGLALIVTSGFKAILEIARQSVPQGYGNSYFWVKPERIVPLHHVREVRERLDYRGNTLMPLDEADAECTAIWLRDQGLDCIGVCFLHAYANPAHERQMQSVLARVHPHAHVSLSSDVLPEYREYERAVTTLVDAFVKPRVGRYVGQIQQRVTEAVRPGTPFYIMKSNGGVISATEVGAQPVTTILSGPAAGALGAARLASTAGFDRILTMDGGGTSTDVAVIEGGEPQVTTSGMVGRFPVKVPMLDVVTVGAGGGSIAAVGPDGRLRVGPRSAGADPGPMCYARGGNLPTVTDAALLLDRIPPHLLGGEIRLDRQLAEEGLEALARQLGLDALRTAAGVLEIAAWGQANALRQVTVRRGLDVRDYVLVAFGGSGPMHAATLVDVLSLRGALVPRDPGNVSAFGLLTVDLKNDFVATTVQRHDRLDHRQLRVVFESLEARARDSLRREGFAESDMLLVRSADLRYAGQAWEVRVSVPVGKIDGQLASATVNNFHIAHHKAYGYSYAEAPDQVVEWVNVRVTGIGPIPRPTLARMQRARVGAAVPRGVRRVVFAEGACDTALYARDHLQPGDSLRGPAIVEEFGSTTVVPPGMLARVDVFGNLLLERDA